LASLRRYAIASLIVWLVVLVILIPQIIELDKRLEYSEEAFIPKESESFKGLIILLSLNYTVGDYILVVFSPNDLETSKRVEDTVRIVLQDLNLNGNILGPYTIYATIRGYIIGNITYKVNQSIVYYNLLVKMGEEARRSYIWLLDALNKTYGLAYAYLNLYIQAKSMGVEDPAEYAYLNLSTRLSGDLAILLYLFQNNFKKAIETLEPREAAREAMLETIKLVNIDLYNVLTQFRLEDYTNSTRVTEYIYNVSRAQYYNMTFDNFKILVDNPRDGAFSVVSERLRVIDMCLVDVLRESIKNGDIKSLVESYCSSLLDKLALYPNVIPDDLRIMLISNSYAILYVSLRESVDVILASQIIKSLDDMLKSNVREAYYYGTIPFYYDLSEKTVREIRRIDVTTAVLVIILLIALIGSLAAPLVILLATGMALAVGLGLLSIASLYIDVYYLSRALMIPVIFGITVDYSVFYLFRVVEERSKGYSWDDAVYQAWRRAGRALMLGGIAIVLGFSAYVLTPLESLRGIGLALTIASATGFLSSYTLLPALLLILGENRVFWPYKSLRLPVARQAIILKSIAAHSLKIRGLIVLATIVVILGLLLYLTSVQPSANVYLSMTGDSRYVEASRVLFTNFPVEVFSKVYIITRDYNIDYLVERLRGEGLVKDINIEKRGEYTVITSGLPVDPLDDRVFNIVESIRNTARELGTEIYLTGFPTLRIDAVSSILDTYFTYTLPLAIVLILLYLIIGMGSLLVPLRLLVTVVFSATTSLALTTIVFYNIIGGDIYGSFIRSPIYWITPIVVLGLIITLGMDYDIFLTSRIREEYEKTRDDKYSIIEAVEKTGVVITVCGLILAGAFSSLLLTQIATLRQVGFAIALSILIDTFIVRPVIVPAIMAILGKYNWWPGRGLIRRWD